jgi:hypothetical protein
VGGSDGKTPGKETTFMDTVDQIIKLTQKQRQIEKRLQSVRDEIKVLLKRVKAEDAAKAQNK